MLFLTIAREYALDAFDVDACGYLLKPLDKKRFDQLLLSASRRLAWHENSKPPHFSRCSSRSKGEAKALGQEGQFRVFLGEAVYQCADHFLPGGIWSDEECFQSIEDDQSFYINNSGQLVIVFDEYEVAPGSMGMPEFVIPSPLRLSFARPSAP